jgi:hypothetical protein
MTLLEQRNQSTYTHLPPPSAGNGRHAATGEASVSVLAAQLGEQLSRLVHDELALAQEEAKQRAKRIGLGVGMFGAGGLFAFFGACCGVVAAIIGFSNVLQPWLAAIIVGALLFVLAGLTVLPGWKGVKERRPPVVNDTAENVKADVAVIKQAMHR